MDEKQQPPPYQSQEQAPPPGSYPPGAVPPGSYPPGQYPPQQPYPPGQTVVVTQPVVVAPMNYGHHSQRVNCPHCHADVATEVEYEIGLLNWAICGAIILIGLGLPCLLLGCCFIPFCINDCKDVVHKCPSCHETLAHVPRLK